MADRLSIPKSTKTKYSSKTGKVALTFENNVDAVNYTLNQLIYAANRDVGIYLAKLCNARGKEILRGFENNKGKRVSPYAKLAPKGDVKSPAFQYWSRKKENDLIIGTKTRAWYGEEQELGLNGQPKKSIMYDTVKDHIDEIRDIQAQYLSAISDAQKAQRMAEEAEGQAEFE